MTVMPEPDRGALLRVLSSAGFSHPVVTSTLVPDVSTRSVTVVFLVETGRRARFGPLEVTGLPDATVTRLTRRVRSTVPEGERWQGERLDNVEAALGRVPSFAQVDVSPGAQDAEGHAPVPGLGDGVRSEWPVPDSSSGE